MVETLLNSCKVRFIDKRHGKKCSNCTYEGYCPNAYSECEQCLKLIHYPSLVSDDAPPRSYNCRHMIDYYLCKYGSRYISELIYAFGYLKDLKKLKTIKVLSFGCGPCTDLLALDFLRQSGEYNYSSLEYHGVDYNKVVWNNIHKEIKTLCPDDTKILIYNKDAHDYLIEAMNDNWVPDLVVFQYFFSDMRKNVDASRISSFINSFSNYANTKMPINSYIILNDINLSTDYGGGREYFDKILRQMNRVLHAKGYFHNNTSQKTYIYGHEYEKNDLFFDTSAYDLFTPHKSCSSAQMIIKKSGEAT